ncbi:MAG: hypothetical protein N3A01_04955 [Bacteroidales bacterium]|nr:hypothetical protein [Bacteroidales bacterium]
MKDKVQQILQEIANIKVDKINIISENIPLNTQLEYFNLSQKVKREGINYEQVISKASNLSNNDSIDEIKRILAELASIPKPEAYRIIENFYNTCDDELKNWAKLALIENRVLLESELLEQHQVIISTGLGGVDDKLRFFVVFLHVVELDDSLKKIIEIETKIVLENYKGVVEEINFNEGYTTMLFLLPIEEDVKEVMNSIITEINKYKKIVERKYIITNIKKLSKKEIEFFIKENNFKDK